MIRRTDPRGVTILHVSDTQFGRHHRFAEGVHSLAANLVLDLRRLQDEGVPPIDLVVVSGDIAEMGSKAEYEQARAFLDAVCAHTALDHDRVVVVPATLPAGSGGAPGSAGSSRASWTASPGSSG